MMHVDFLFDVGSPNAYLSHAAIPGIQRRTGSMFRYIPVLLGGIFKLTNNQSPMAAFGGVRNKLEFQRLEMARFIRRYGVERFRMNPHFPVNSLLVMRGAVAAELDEVLAPYVDAVFRAMWEEGRKVDDANVVRAALDHAGLDASRLLSRAQDQEVKDTLARNTGQAVERGAFGSPTFFVGNEMFFGKDQLRDVEEALQTART